MAVLSRLVQDFVIEQRLGFHATVRPDGSPNLSPKGTTTVFDDERLFFADIHSPQTTRNLRVNPAIEVNVVDPLLRRGYRFRGRAAVCSAGPVYRRGLELLKARGYATEPRSIRAVVLITVDAVEELKSPAYDGGRSEAEVSGPWKARMRQRLKGVGSG